MPVIDSFVLDATVMTGSDTSVGVLTVKDHGGRSMTFEGFSKRRPEDKPCPDVGSDLALARSLEAAAKFYRRRALRRDASNNAG